MNYRCFVVMSTEINTGSQMTHLITLDKRTTPEDAMLDHAFNIARTESEGVSCLNVINDFEVDTNFAQ